MCTGNVQLVVLCMSLGDRESIQSTRLHFPLSLSLTVFTAALSLVGSHWMELKCAKDWLGKQCGFTSLFYNFFVMLQHRRKMNNSEKTVHQSIVTSVAPWRKQKFTCTGSNNLFEQKYTESFKWSPNYHFKAGRPLFSKVFVQVSLDGLPSDMAKKCRLFWIIFWEKLQCSCYLGVLGMTEISLTHWNSHLKAEPLVIQISKTSLQWSSANLPLLGMWLWDSTECKRN